MILLIAWHHTAPSIWYVWWKDQIIQALAGIATMGSEGLISSLFLCIVLYLDSSHVFSNHLSQPERFVCFRILIVTPIATPSTTAAIRYGHHVYYCRYR